MPESVELSERELEILRLVATGASNKEIAQRLFISTNTVKVHLRNIFAKIGAASRTEAAMYAVAHGLANGATESASPASGAETAQAAGVDLLPAMSPDLPPLAVETPTVPVPAWRTGRLWVLLGLFGLLAIASIWAFVNSVRGAAEPPAATNAANPPARTAAPRWQARAPMPTVRYGFAIAAFENHILAIGGDTGEGPTAVVESYDPKQDVWEPLVDKPTPVAEVGAAVIGGLVYVPGGRTGQSTVTDVLEIFDPHAGEWSQGPPMPQALAAYAITAYEGKMYLFGGWDGQNYLDTVFVYDPGSGEWQERPPMPRPRAYAGAVVAMESIFVFGGTDGDAPLIENDRYAPNSGEENAWTEAAPLPEGRYAMGYAAVAELVYVTGGQSDQDDAVLSNLQYLPLEDRWQVFETADSRSWERGSLVIYGTNLHLIGGFEGGLLTGRHSAYQAIYVINMPVIE